MQRIMRVAIAAVIGGLLVSTPALGETVILFNVYVPKHHPHFVGSIKPLIEQVPKVTQGRVKIVTPAASLAPYPRQWSMVVSGIADGTIVYDGIEAKRLELPLMAALPFMSSGSAEANSIAAWRTQQKFFNKANEYKGVHLLAQNGTPGHIFHNNKREIKSIDDLKGLKIWAPGGAKAVYSALGMVPVASPGTKIFEYVSKGVVDGLSSPLSTTFTWKVAKYLKYTLLVPGRFFDSTFSVYVSQKKWDSISKRDQEAIMREVAGERLSANGGRQWDILEEKGRQALLKNNVKITQPSPQLLSAMKERLAIISEEWIKKAGAKGVDGRAAIAFYLAESKKLAKQIMKK